MGHLGWSEREFLESSLEGVYYAFQGYFYKRELDEKVFRNLGYITYKVAGGKIDDPQKIWPIGEVKKDERTVTWGTPEERQKTMEQIMKAHNIKINGRDKNTDKR